MFETSNEIIKIARQLGDALKESDEYKKFCETRDAMKQNSDLKAKLDEFKIQKSVFDIEKEKEDADEHVLDVISSRMEALYNEISDIPEMKAYNEAEENLNMLMTAVNMTISSYIGAEEYTTEPEKASGNAPDNCVHDCSKCHLCD
ncbi:MAG: YlbF family regulator [Clostridia bacterium]|nr:YlbF family regulator [Clostridia bacterium]